LRSNLATSAACAQKPLIPLSEARSFPDFSKVDEIYDDIDANQSVIELWRQDQARQAKGDKGLPFLPTGFSTPPLAPKFQPNYPSEPPTKAELVSTDEELGWTEDLGIPYEQYRRLKKKVIQVKRTVQMTRKGKIPSMSALVVVGNGAGGAGFGEGKDSEAPRAVMKATRQAIKNIQHIPRYDDRTIYHDIYHKFKATKIHFWARRPGFGCRVNPVIHEICDCIGIQDLAGKVHGSRNPMNVVKGTFAALTTQQLPEVIARSRGKRLIDVYHAYYGGIN
ncbi:28S ribosomal protein S5, mitochondrial, partial [Spiromyces aspiralis]